MAWRDLGVVFRVSGQKPWMQTHGYVPTALLLGDRIRIFTAFWDADSVGRMGFVDVAASDPTKVLGYAPAPVLDVGLPGTFDEHGITPLAVHKVNGDVWLHYAGWQRTPDVRYLLFTGLAISRDDGATFRRHSNVPVFDRSDQHYLVRTGFVVHDGGRWKAWAAQSDGIIDVNGKPTPTYSLGYMESEDGIHWPAAAQPVLRTTDEIFGYGRSAVWWQDGQYHGLFSVRRHVVGYRIEYSTSPDGLAWEPLSQGGMAFLPEQTTPRQSETMFPSLVQTSDKLLMFYNGDSFGQEGIRAAAWEP